ncbi:MAG TPA: RluA family pseudouridine synthase, partial [Rubrobacteraceae bacterium]|nr:RluA family pseudouridine synthase [Rubrobacteraceae bacterium]
SSVNRGDENHALAADIQSFEVAPEEAGERLDKLVAWRLGVSRSAARRMIEEGLVQVGGSEAAPARKARDGERIEARLVEKELTPEDIPVPVAFEDEHLLVVDKPAGLVVHPGAGNRSGTLVNALLDRGIAGGEDPERPGVVHRLDRDTSGLMVLAKGEEAYSGLVAALSARRVKRVYRAIVVGKGLPETGTIDSPVGRDPDNPTLMAVGAGKTAVTNFKVVHRAAGYTMLRVRLETGRTHQIRVHLKAIGHPVYADPLYGEAVPGRRLWLHAERLALVHPVTGEALEFDSPVPEDLREAAWALDPGFPA